MLDPGPASSTVSDALLRAALHLALDVARVGARSSPPMEPPRGLRPFLHFSGRLPDAALQTVRRSIDEDEGFRSRMVGLADEQELGRAGWLFVVRPDGWEVELASLSEEAEATARAEREAKEERSAQRRLRRAEAATERAEAAAARARAERDEALAQLAATRKAHQAADEEVAHLTRRVTSLEGERASARRRAEEATARATGLEAELGGLRTEAARSRAELAEARASVESLRADLARARAAPAPSARTRRAGAGPAAASPEPAPEVAPPDVSAAVAAVAAAASAASALGRALDDASAALARSRPPPGPDRRAGDRPPPVRPAPARRRPARLPPAVFDDSTEAASHLVRVPDAELLVDGYNVAKSLWPDTALPELRDRLLDALNELVARTGVSVHVVYDGADLGPTARQAASRHGVRVSFSPADVEADDVVLELVEEIPLHRPVVVASSDRRVQEGARSRGANVISSAQLAAVLGRS